MNNQHCPQRSLEDTRKAYQFLFNLRKEACVSRDRADMGISGHLTRILACLMSLIPASQRYDIIALSRSSGSFKVESRVQLEQLASACIQYTFSLRAAIERGCWTRADHAETRLLTSSDPKARRVAIAPFRIIRAQAWMRVRRRRSSPKYVLPEA